MPYFGKHQAPTTKTKGKIIMIASGNRQASENFRTPLAGVMHVSVIWTASPAKISKPSGDPLPYPEPKGAMTMRFMILIKADRNTEAGVMPDEKLLTEMGKYNEELVKAGVLLAGEGLHPSSKGARVKFSGDKRTVIDGPFADTNGMIAGFWLWQVKSKEEAIEWVKRCPNPTGVEAEIEIRQLFEAEDFGAEFTPELREQEERLRAQVAAKQ
jgi:hypothetical protein